MTPEAHKILNKFQKTELATQKIELANLQSVVKLDDTAFKIKDKTLASAKKAQDFLIDVSNNANAAISAFNAVIDEVTTLEKQAADLGLALPNDARVARDSAKRELSQFTDLKSKVSGIKL